MFNILKNSYILTSENVYSKNQGGILIFQKKYVEKKLFDQSYRDGKIITSKYCNI